MISKLTFENKIQIKEEGIRDRDYIDFIINNKSLNDILGDVHPNIGKFGWKINVEYELNELYELSNFDKSRHNNGLFSIYVCPECGDEGCLAVMFEKQTIKDSIIWSNFVWSNGYDEIDESHIKFDIDPIEFDKKSYEKSLNMLRALIKN